MLTVWWDMPVILAFKRQRRDIRHSGTVYATEKEPKFGGKCLWG